MWRKAMLYLGLGPDEEYDDYDPAHDDGMDRPAPRDRRPGGRAVQRQRPSSYPDEPSAIGAVRPDQRPRRSAPSPVSRSSRPA